MDPLLQEVLLPSSSSRKRKHVDDIVSEDESPRVSPKSYTSSMDDDRRAHHNELERKRRDHIKDHFIALQQVIPMVDGEKCSRAFILKKAVEYINEMKSLLQETQALQKQTKIRHQTVDDKLRIQSVAPKSMYSFGHNPSNPISKVHKPMEQVLHKPKPLLHQPSPVVQPMQPVQPMQLPHLNMSSQETISLLTQALLQQNIQRQNMMFPFVSDFSGILLPNRNPAHNRKTTNMPFTAAQ